MAYLSNLNDLDLGEYSNPELIELAKRIAKQVGAGGAWELIETACECLQSEKSRSCVVAIRSCPDTPTAMEQMLFTPPLGDIAYAKNISIPMLAAMTIAIGHAGIEVMKYSGIGPLAYSEIIRTEVYKQHQRYGGSDGDLHLVTT